MICFDSDTDDKEMHTKDENKSSIEKYGAYL